MSPCVVPSVQSAALVLSDETSQKIMFGGPSLQSELPEQIVFGKVYGKSKKYGEPQHREDLGRGEGLDKDAVNAQERKSDDGRHAQEQQFPARH